VHVVYYLPELDDYVTRYVYVPSNVDWTTYSSSSFAVMPTQRIGSRYTSDITLMASIMLSQLVVALIRSRSSSAVGI